MAPIDGVYINTQTARQLIERLEPVFSAAESFRSGEIEIAAESTATTDNALYCFARSGDDRFAVVTNGDIDSTIEAVYERFVDNPDDWTIIYDPRGVIEGDG